MYVEPAPAPLLAPSDARRSVASRGGLAFSVVDAALAGEDVPARSLAAYQRAATVIGVADRRCHLGWETLAAIGKVATDHGRAATTGPRLNGRKGNAARPRHRRRPASTATPASTGPSARCCCCPRPGRW